MKALFVAGWAGDTQRYRAWHQAEQLWFADIPAAVRLADDPMLIADLLDYDTFIFCRASYSPLIAATLTWIQDRGLLSIYDTDDLIFRPELASHVDLLYNMPPADTALHLRQFAANRAALEQCDFVLTSTPYLAQQVNEHTNKQAFVNRNSLNDDQLSYSTEAYNQRQQRLAARKEGDPIVISYLSGSPSHSRDFALCAPALARIMAAHPEVTLLLGGYLSLADTDLFQYEGTARIRRAPFVPWRALPAVQAEADINLAPLELTNPFALGKSELKYFEAAACAVSTIASPTPSFQEAITNGENGLLAETDEQWEAAISQLLDPAERERIGQSARADVYSRYTPEVRATTFAPLLADLWQRKQATAAAQPQRGDNLAWLEAEAIARLHRFAAEQSRLSDAQLIAEYLPDYPARTHPQPLPVGGEIDSSPAGGGGEGVREDTPAIAALQSHLAELEARLIASERQRNEQADLLRRISSGRVMRVLNWLTGKRRL
jgi:glycosyltransferase involved in cell wall biosynthesis